MTSTDAAQVAVRFVTRLPDEYRVPDEPVAVPTSLARYGLSQVVNHLLGADKPTPFDFLLDGHLVRGSLDAALRARRTSAETAVDVEYFFAALPPAPRPAADAPDWVTAVCGRLGPDGVVSGSGDGGVLLWAGGGAPARGAATHAGGVTAVACLAGTDGTAPMVLSAGKDGAVRLSREPGAVGGGKAGRGAVVATYEGHADAVACLAPAPGGATFATGGWDGSVRLWTCDAGAAEGGGPASKKRRPAAGDPAAADATPAAPPPRGPDATLEGHTQCVAAVCWAGEGRLASASWDHSVRRWDAETGRVVDTLHTGGAVFALAAPPGDVGGYVLAFGGAAGAVRLWDRRAAPGTEPGARTLASHSGWVAGAAWHPTAEHAFATAGHDGAAKVWDTRAATPLHTLAAHDGHALCVAWAGAGRLVTGGADAKLREFDVSNPVSL